MEVDTETSPSVQELVSSLEQATLMARRIPATADPYQLHQIRSTLLSAHRRLSLFLNQQPSPPANSVASAAGVAGDDNDVQMGDEEDEQNSRAATTSTVAVDKVEERMRDCFIQNKRPKRALSPSAEQRRSWENEGLRDGAVVAEYDPYTTKLRSLDLIYQFHG
ncbi:uncharacterized protein [Primulina huaijiensis]|uniref:uncharacterized protein n=1 Tax=Primulina huaijiensis TaxID=1492673 RepID=UPI003CC6F6C1